MIQWIELSVHKVKGQIYYTALIFTKSTFPKFAESNSFTTL